MFNNNRGDNDHKVIRVSIVSSARADNEEVKLIKVMPKSSSQTWNLFVSTETALLDPFHHK